MTLGVGDGVDVVNVTARLVVGQDGAPVPRLAAAEHSTAQGVFLCRQCVGVHAMTLRDRLNTATRNAAASIARGVGTLGERAVVVGCQPRGVRCELSEIQSAAARRARVKEVKPRVVILECELNHLLCLMFPELLILRKNYAYACGFIACISTGETGFKLNNLKSGLEAES